MMQNVSFAQIREALKGCHRILVASHLRPDADALGSTIAVAIWLRDEGHEVTAWNEDGMPEKFSFLPCSDLVTKPSEVPVSFDAVLTLDTSIKKRLGTVASVASAPLWICIDHHRSNEGYADLNLIAPDRPATGEILTKAFLGSNIPITAEMAVNLFAAISTDTGSFQYQGTGAETFEIAAALIRCGVDVAEISKLLYESQPRRRLELLRHALVNARFSCQDRVASFCLSLADIARLGIVSEDNEGIIDNLRSVEGVRAAAFFEELPEGKVRLSLRSKDSDFDASALCGLFGGGGHKMASGARIKGALHDVEERVLGAICTAIEKPQS